MRHKPYILQHPNRHQIGNTDRSSVASNNMHWKENGEALGLQLRRALQLLRAHAGGLGGEGIPFGSTQGHVMQSPHTTLQ